MCSLGGSLKLPNLGTSTRSCKLSMGRLRTLDTSPATSSLGSDTPHVERSIECHVSSTIFPSAYGSPCTMRYDITRRLCTIISDTGQCNARHNIYLSCIICGLVLAISFAVGDGRSQFQWLQSKIRTPRIPHKSRQYPSLP